MRRCGNCEMFGNNQQVKYKIAQTILSEKPVAFLCCLHCKDEPTVIAHHGKIYLESKEQLDKLDHWPLPVITKQTKEANGQS